jgi:hypothetical protein
MLYRDSSFHRFTLALVHHSAPEVTLPYLFVSHVTAMSLINDAFVIVVEVLLTAQVHQIV